MTESRWQNFEDQVRGIASLIFGQNCKPDRIAGVNFDGVVFRSDLETVAIEISQQNDLDKVRQGITRLLLARQTLSADGVILRGYIVLSKAPTPSMLDAAKAAKITVSSAGQFASLFFQFPLYRNARSIAAFGSSIDPVTGDIDKVNYIPVQYKIIDSAKDVNIIDICNLLSSGKNVVFLGEYGSGKSRCVREVFLKLSEDWDLRFQFPYAINLRECWGLDRGDEIVRRGSYVLGLDSLAASAVKALNRDSLILLLDGFDELGSQSWSSDEGRLRQLRAKALAGVKDLVSKTKLGCLIAGREHYFSSNDEMISALGLNKSNTVIVKVKDEFNENELDLYFDEVGIDAELPSWLPRKTLICQTIALLSDDELGAMFGITSDGVAFWNHFIRIVCQRDARINAFFDAETIYRVFVALSRITRMRSSNVGPISQRDLQEAFEAVVGQLPVDEASAMLQRLPSLGRIGAESQDRQFVDMFILDGLRAKDVALLPEREESQRKQIFLEKWSNPLGALGQSILAADMKDRIDGFKQMASRASKSQNATLAADILAGMTRIDSGPIIFNDLSINGASFSELALNSTAIDGINLTECTFERIILPNAAPLNFKITSSLCSKVSGAASYTGLPSWIQLD